MICTHISTYTFYEGEVIDKQFGSINHFICFREINADDILAKFKEIATYTHTNERALH